MRHPRQCLANYPGFSSKITSATHFSTLPVPLMLAHHSPYSEWHATQANHTSTQPTSPTLYYVTNASTQSTPPTLFLLARSRHLHTTQASFPSMQASHNSSTQPTKACHPCNLILQFLIPEKFRGME